MRWISALRIGLRMTKPESQNTGIDTTQPIICTAVSGRFWPTRRITMSASLNAAPDFSSAAPISAPKMMTMPMLVKVPEKPCPITVAMPAAASLPSGPFWSTSGTPATTPNTSDTARIARKGWIFQREIATIMTMTATTKARMAMGPLMKHLLECKHLITCGSVCRSTRRCNPAPTRAQRALWHHAKRPDRSPTLLFSQPKELMCFPNTAT